MKKGTKMTIESRNKIRLSRIGRKFDGGWKLSEETKQRQRNAKIGFTPVIAIEKARIKNTGSKHTEEHKKKIGDSHRGEKNYRWKGGEKTKKIRKCFYERRRNIRKLNNGGSHTLGDWETLKAQYNFTCPCCHKSEPEIKLTEDHIIPLSKGGSDNIENIQPLCGSCNTKKMTKIIKYYKKLI